MDTSELNIRLELANKLIFVKEYKRAESLIEELVTTEQYSQDLLVHLRRIELATKLDNLDQLLSQYQAEMEKSPELEAVQKEYLRLASCLWAGTDPLAPDSLKDREIFDLLGFD